MEDSDQNIHLKNLSLQQATNEEEALNLLFLGDTNRMIAEVRFTASNLNATTVKMVKIISPPLWNKMYILEILGHKLYSLFECISTIKLNKHFSDDSVP